MAVKKNFAFDESLRVCVGLSTDDFPEDCPVGSYFLSTDERLKYIYSTTGGWVAWEKMST